MAQVGAVRMADAPPQALIDEIRQLVSEHTNVRVEKIKPETTLAGDLGVEGDDAFELLEDYAQRFHVSFAGFVFLDHFGWEGSDPFTPTFIFAARIVSPTFRRLWSEATANEREITIEHLVTCAKLGRWVPSRDRRKPGRRSVLILIFALFFLVPAYLFGAAMVLGPPFLFGGGLVLAALGHFDKAIVAIIAASAAAIPGLLLYFSITRRFLRDKEVWRRKSPVAV